jgi:REP element-mobilizing transposase RayT
MSQSLAQIYIHIVFSTKNRVAIIDDKISTELYAYLGGICKALASDPIKIGGYYDHVHILCKLSKKITLIKLLEEIKKSSSKWIKTKGLQYGNFYWQDGYVAFSVNPAQVDSVANYIEHQKEHHQKKTFQEECRFFFKKYKIDFDERYVWD